MILCNDYRKKKLLVWSSTLPFPSLSPNVTTEQKCALDLVLVRHQYLFACELLSEKGAMTFAAPETEQAGATDVKDAEPIINIFQTGIALDSRLFVC